MVEFKFIYKLQSDKNRTRTGTRSGQRHASRRATETVHTLLGFYFFSVSKVKQQRENNRIFGISDKEFQWRNQRDPDG